MPEFAIGSEGICFYSGGPLSTGAASSLCIFRIRPLSPSLRDAWDNRVAFRRRLELAEKRAEETNARSAANAHAAADRLTRCRDSRSPRWINCSSFVFLVPRCRFSIWMPVRTALCYFYKFIKKNNDNKLVWTVCLVAPNLET